MKTRRDQRPTSSVFFSRRDVLRAGVGGLGLNLAGLLSAQAAHESRTGNAATDARIKACIIVFYYGGPSHLDTYDLKPNAPAEVRGEFKPIATSVPGLHISEHLPNMAKRMHKVALVRSMHHRNRLHDSASTEALTGRQSPTGDREEFAPIEQFFPCYGAAVNYHGRDRGIEIPHAALPFVFHNVVDVPCQGGGFLGSAFDPLQITVDPNTRAYQVGALTLRDELGFGRISNRRDLLASLDPGTPTGDAERKRFYDRAFKLLSSDRLRHALDLTKEDPRTRERYGLDHPPAIVGSGGGGGNGAELGVARQMRGLNLLVARRLVEAGVPFVNVYDFRQQGQNWDAHFKCFNQHKTHLLPIADRSLAALLDDLEVRGLLDSTLVVAMGEFGRTPKINGEGGRDHWPDCYTILLAGGGVKGGFVHGASDRLGAFPDRDAVTPADLAATIYWRFGLDPALEIRDQTGRPYKLADGEPVRSLFA